MIVLGGLGPAAAAPLTPGNLLVSTGSFTAPASNTVFEYTSTGSQIQGFSVPYPGGRPNTENVQDVVVDQDGRVQIYNGTFAPFLTTLTPTAGGPGAGTFTNNTFAGLSTTGSGGGIGVLGNFAYLADAQTGSPGGPEGIVRFDLTTFSATRFASDNSSTGYGKLTIGADGLLYALPNSTPTNIIDVYDPVSMSEVRRITLSDAMWLGTDIGGIAVDALGLIYATASDGNIYQLSQTGSVLNMRATGASNLRDIDLDNDGRLVAAAAFYDRVNAQSYEGVILTTTSLESQTSFSISQNSLVPHVAFTTPLMVIPEPSTGLLLASGLLSLVAAMGRRTS
ncbi:MAG TPA: hypothetical protein VMS55_03095 [Myxococcota bacterium]|nr:hypothetical protein [Myxococcota bacterium]